MGDIGSPTQHKEPVKLDPDEAYPAILIDQFLSGGITVIATSVIQYGRIFRRMMAKSVATGEPFLGSFQTKQSDVLFIEYGEADCKAAEQWGLTGEHVQVRNGWPQMPACICEIQESPIKVIFLPDYAFLDGSLGDYMKRHHNLSEPDVRSIDYYRRQKSRIEIEQLRDCAAGWQRYLILTAGNLTVNRKLRDFPGLGAADCIIKVYEHEKAAKRRQGILTLQVVGGDYIGSNEFEMVLDKQTGIFRLTPETLRRYAKLPLNENDREILAALELWPMTEAEIRNFTRIPRTTVYQRLKYLAGDQKGRLVVKTLDGKWTRR